MSQNIEENRKKWPKIKDIFKVGKNEVNSEKVWEPPSDYEKGGQYGKVKAYTWRGGQSVEIDETPGGERIRVTHPNGSYIDMQADGTVIKRSTKDDHEVILGDKNVRVAGDVHVFIDGNANVKIAGNADTEVSGNLTATIGGSTDVTSSGAVIIKTPHLDIRGDKCTHNGTDIGDTHKHGGVESGGSITDVPV